MYLHSASVCEQGATGCRGGGLRVHLLPQKSWGGQQQRLDLVEVHVSFDGLHNLLHEAV